MHFASYGILYRFAYLIESRNQGKISVRSVLGAGHEDIVSVNDPYDDGGTDGRVYGPSAVRTDEGSLIT